MPTKKKPGVKKKTATKKNVSPALTRKVSDFIIVAIGSSSGGLEAATVLFRNLAADTGMAFIYVQHLSPNHKSLLTPILSKVTAMKVQVIKNMEHIEPNNVYVIPNDKGIEITDGHIKLIPRVGGAAITIDILFASLALTHKENIVGIVLSGNAHDGTRGLKAIKKAGGITIAQNESASAKSMPESAIASGAVDFVLSPKAIALKLIQISKTGIKKHRVVRNDLTTPVSVTKEIISDSDPELKVVLDFLKLEHQVDFKLYKSATIKRRIKHRMRQCGLNSLSAYSKFLLKKNNERHLLYKDLLIHVTCFFRDPEVFAYLNEDVLPLLLKNKGENETLRVWVPACSTGEEVYTIAILLSELQEKKTKKIPVQIFATDLSDQAIRAARMGEYEEPELKNLDKRRKMQFFTKTGNCYKIIKEIRDMCVFAPHNILLDPPFSRMDFVSCRNLLIYFDLAAQKKALTTINFSLADSGFLMLGKSETTGTASPFFNPLSGKFKIYSKKRETGLHELSVITQNSTVKPIPAKMAKPSGGKNEHTKAYGIDQLIDSTLLSFYAPACVIINKNMDIIKFRGETALYLSHPTGIASLNILKMTRPEFVFELRNAVQEVIKTNKPVLKSDIHLNTDETDLTLQVMSLEVRPLLVDWGEPLFMVVFIKHDLTHTNGSRYRKGQAESNEDLALKKRIVELNKASLEMIAVIESQDKAYEELQAANEEIISASEEFQTLNEELETSREEIEATNEELLTTNQELQMRNEQLAESYNFSEAISDTMHEPMLILDKSLRVKSANAAFYKKFHVMQVGTEGTLLYELGNRQWNIPSLRKLLENIVRKNTHFYAHEITHTFPEIGKKTMLLNARRIIQKTQNEQLILLTFIDTTAIIKKRTRDDKGLENMIAERTQALETSYKTVKEKNLYLEKVKKELEKFTFISNHDLQEPVRKIKMFTSCLLEEEEHHLSETGKDYLQKTLDVVGQMQLLIDDLLIYSNAKETKHNFETLELHQLVNEAINSFSEEIRLKRAIIKMDVNCQVRVIAVQFRQLITNLISNSLKFLHPKRFPRITFKCQTTPGRLLHFSSIAPELNYCHISISDNGIGFDDQYKERIFEVFQHLHGHKQYKGTGIGLAVCRRIIDNHKGVITASSKLNKGSTFNIYLPMET